ncbi:hypothetical protein OAN96_01125 [Candidatus Gracilibacteria bacterium]|nr:hypothetical protein [Candidatus Gracilibacteria bacterium]
MKFWDGFIDELEKIYTEVTTIYTPVDISGDLAPERVKELEMLNLRAGVFDWAWKNAVVVSVLTLLHPGLFVVSILISVIVLYVRYLSIGKKAQALRGDINKITGKVSSDQNTVKRGREDLKKDAEFIVLMRERLTAMKIYFLLIAGLSSFLVVLGLLLILFNIWFSLNLYYVAGCLLMGFVVIPFWYAISVVITAIAANVVSEDFDISTTGITNVLYNTDSVNATRG